MKWIALASDEGFMAALEFMEKAYRLGEHGLSVDAAKANQLKQKMASIRGLKEKKSRRRGDKE